MPNLVPDMSSKIDLGNVPSQPTINGSNFFTGNFDSNKGNFGIPVDNQADWDNLWKSLGDEPPGPLPSGAMAVFQAFMKKDVSTSVSLKNIEIKGSKVKLDWERAHVAKEDDMRAHSRYAVLILPKNSMLMASFNEVWPVREKRLRDLMLKEAIKVFRKGVPAGVKAPPTAKFTHVDLKGLMKPPTPVEMQSMS